MGNIPVGLLAREKEIIRLLHALEENHMGCIVVGGYAVATYKKRFSVDLDLVIKEEDLEKFEAFCKKEGYSIGYGKDIHLLYGEKFRRYMKAIKKVSVSIDLLINGLVSRATDATWSFAYIEKHSKKGTVEGATFVMPEKELLIAMKLHAGRLGDIRDIVAMMPCDRAKLENHVLKGAIYKLVKNVRRQAEFLEKPQFDDSFKGVFGMSAYNSKHIEEARKVIRKILSKCEKT